MNDRYLYRAKRTDNGEWVEGSLITGVFFRLGQDIPYILCPDKADYDCFEDFTEENGIFEVDPSTICQCTGLKDKNGKLIWENDIVKEEFKAIGVVHYGMHDYNIGFNIKWVNEYGWAYRREVCYWAQKVEIIGNTIDNPELLEVGE